MWEKFIDSAAYGIIFYIGMITTGLILLFVMLVLILLIFMSKK